MVEPYTHPPPVSWNSHTTLTVSCFHLRSPSVTIQAGSQSLEVRRRGLGNVLGPWGSGQADLE